MKKLIVSLMIAISSLFGAVAGAGNDGRIMDKLYLDIYLSNNQINYQYASTGGGRINLNTRKLNKAFNQILDQNVMPKFTLSGKIALPNDIGTDATVFIKGHAGSSSHHRSVVYINNKKATTHSWKSHAEHRANISVNRDKMNNPYADVRIEVFAVKQTKGSNVLDRLKKQASGLTFNIIYSAAQTKRGQNSSSVTVPARFYCMEE